MAAAFLPGFAGIRPDYAGLTSFARQVGSGFTGMDKKKRSFDSLGARGFTGFD